MSDEEVRRGLDFGDVGGLIAATRAVFLVGVAVDGLAALDQSAPTFLQTLSN
jgi:hypothetical protein